MNQLCAILFLLSTTIGFSQDKAGLKLWYNKPAGNTWENALPIGNGKLGAMIYGNVDTEIVQLNENTVWSGSPNRNDNPLALDSLTVIRDLIFKGEQKEAEAIANRVIISKKSQGQMFEPVGNLLLAFHGHQDYSHYYRELDLENAIQKTTYQVGDISYMREVIASFPDRLIVMHLTASTPASISCTASFSTPEPNAVIRTNAAKELTIDGTTIDHEGAKGMVKFKGIAKFKLSGGTLSTTDNALTIKNATEVTIYVSVATNFNNYHDLSGNAGQRASGYLDQGYSKS